MPRHLDRLSVGLRLLSALLDVDATCELRYGRQRPFNTEDLWLCSSKASLRHLQSSLLGYRNYLVVGEDLGV